MQKNIFTAVATLILFGVFSSAVTGSPESWRKTGTDAAYPAGSSDYINLFNGHLNFTLPLLSMKGRGSSEVVLPLSIGNDTWHRFTFSEPFYIFTEDSGTQEICSRRIASVSVKFQGQTDTEEQPQEIDRNRDCTTVFTGNGANGQQFLYDLFYHFAIFDPRAWADPGYGPGLLYAVYDPRTLTFTSGGITTQTNIPNIGFGRTTLTFALPDGSTSTLVDTQTMGRFLNYSIANGVVVGPERGKNFTSLDGSSMTFISDTVIRDPAQLGYSSANIDPIHFYPTGYLLTRDGTRYRIEQGLIQWERDVNGNKTLFTYVSDPNNPAFRKLSTITDSLGRGVQIFYNLNDSSLAPDGTPYGLRDEMHYPGISGVDEKVIVTKTDLGSDLRSGFTLKHKNELWDHATSSSEIFTKQVIKSVWMPNDKAFNFRYDSYGELSRVEFPTGGGSEYDYDFLENTTLNGEINNVSLLRRVAEKRIYENIGDPNSLVNKTTISNIYPPRDLTDVSAFSGLPIQVDVKDASGSILSRTKHYFKGDPANRTDPNYFDQIKGIEDPLNGKEIKTEILNPLTQQVYERTEFNWQIRVPGSSPFCNLHQPCPASEIDYIPSIDPLLVETKTTLRPDFNGGIVTKTSAINPSNGSFAFDTHNNRTDVWEYDGNIGTVASRPARHRHVDFLAVNPSNGIDYANPSGGTDYLATDLHMRSLPSGEQLYAINPSTGAETLLSKSEIRYDESVYPILSETSVPNWEDPQNSTRGNPTTARTWFQEENRWLETHSQFDQFGNLRKTWDATSDPNRFTETQYSATYAFGFPTKVIAPPLDPSDLHGANQTTTAETTYDFSTGSPLTVKDDFGQITATEYDVASLRPRRTYGVNVSMPESQIEYSDTPGNLFVKVKKQLDATNWDEATTFVDGLGRTTKTQAKDSQGDVFAETHYDALGRVDRVTNPYRTGDTVYWSKTRYDELGRAVETFAPETLSNLANARSLGVTSFDISNVTNFVGTVVTSSDASGRKSRSITNGLGQLIRVDEPTATSGTADADLGQLATPAQPTFYTYSPQGKMVKVSQGAQSRYFLYDSLGRLLRVRQPEQEINSGLGVSDPITGNSQWTAGFTYDVLGNVITATDAKGTVITNTYDKANRVTARTYSNEPTGVTTPAVNFYYDGKGLDTPQSPNYAKGKLTKVENGVSQTRYTQFDNFGRLVSTEQRTPLDGQTIANATPYVSSYQYNLSGALVQETYPSGRVVKNEFESDGDLSRIYGNATASAPERTYANSFLYTTDGKIERLRLGNGLWEKANFNSRMQVTELNLGHGLDGDLWKLGYQYGEIDSSGNVDATKNTGNIARQTLTFNGLAQPFVQSYKYDSLYRLTDATETNNDNQTWKEIYGYDRYGNRSSHAKFLATTQLTADNKTDPTIDPNTNRFDPNQGYTYDKNGNLTVDADGRGFTFNGDNKQTKVVQGGQTVGEYTYDGEGKRVRKKTYANGELTEETVFVYSSGKLVAEYSTKPPPQNPTTSFTATDKIGSPRVITNSLGEVVARRDFVPFGEAVVPDGAIRTTGLKYNYGDDIRQKFTGYQKDDETNLDFAEARMYQDLHGRFTAVDPLLTSGRSANPQSFNRYVYTLNNPLSLTDPSGLQEGTDPNVPVDGVIERVYTMIDKAGRDVSSFFNGLVNNTRDYRANQLLNGTNSQLDNINYDRARFRLNAAKGYVDVDNPFTRKLVGNKGDAIDDIIQQTTDTYDTAFKIGEANLAFQLIWLAAPAFTGGASTMAPEGIPASENEFSPLPESYFNMDNTVDMNECPVPKGFNAAGSPRNGNWFFKQLLTRNPEQFSDENVNNIVNLRRAPRVDEQWIEYNRTHRNFLNQRLIHHHIDQGNVAVPLPEQIHWAWDIVLHSVL